MKLNKIFAIALAALTLTACSDDDDASVNSKAGVSVSMLDPTFDIDENVEYFEVPLQVTGETNGQVVVTLEVKPGPANENDPENPTEPAQEGEHYFVTSKTVHIPAGQTTFGVEVRNEWVKGFINDARVFTISIVKAEGATVGAVKDCVVTIANVDDAYTGLCGQWRFTGEYLFNGATPIDESCVLAMETPDPVSEAEYYGEELYAYGFRGRDNMYATFAYDFDEATQEVSLAVVTATYASTSLMNFGLGTTPTGIPIYGMLVAASQYARGQVVFGDDIEVTVNADRNDISFEETDEFYFMVMPYYYGGGGLQMQNLGYFGGWDHMHMEKL